MRDLHELSAATAARAIRAKELSPTDLLAACLERADAAEPVVQAWVHLDREGALWAGTEGAGVDTHGLAHPGDTLVELYVAYLNAPTIGRALLGDIGWKNLMGKLDEGQQALWIGNAGPYPMVDERFVPGGIPQRLSLYQDGLSLELRDMVFDFAPPTGAPPLNASQIFTVYAGAGMDPGRTMELRLLLIREKGMILPQITRQTATLSYAPPETLFSYRRGPCPSGSWPGKPAWRTLPSSASPCCC